MDLINLVGDRLFLDYLITSNFDFTYENNTVNITYSSFLEVSDIDTRLFSLESELDSKKKDENKDSDQIELLERAIQILNDLKAKIS